MFTIFYVMLCLIYGYDFDFDYADADFPEVVCDGRALVELSLPEIISQISAYGHAVDPERLAGAFQMLEAEEEPDTIIHQLFSD
jgi:hypothetical protein